MKLGDNKICQSCGYPLLKEENGGKNTDGTRNKDYCIMCYNNGKFTHPDITMGEMIEYAAKGLAEFEPKLISYEQAKQYVSRDIPQLRRWRKK